MVSPVTTSLKMHTEEPNIQTRSLNFILRLLAIPLGILLISCEGPELDFVRASYNGKLANEGFIRCNRYMTAWLKHVDPESGLIPRNLDDDSDIWNASDAAADNYPYMVLTAAILDRELFSGKMTEMLHAERRLTSRLGTLPDTYSFRMNGFLTDHPDIDDIIFGASEYVKDGLLPLTEWLGSSSWSDRMIEMLDDLWSYAPVKTRFGDIVSADSEINGEMLQTLSRVYWMTGYRKYLEWAVRLGDYYLLGEHHPTDDFTTLRLRDHGCEVISGLCELYATLHFAWPEKKRTYQESLYRALNRILAIGRNEHGLFYNSVNPQKGIPIDYRIADTWGYTYNGYYTVYFLESYEQYRHDLLEAMSQLHSYYRHYDWENGSADGDADAIESALNLYNREPLPSMANWIDSEIHYMWGKQDSSHLAGDAEWRGNGVIEGWHGDGNFARTTIMYCLWKTRGVTVRPWRKDVVYGSVTRKNQLIISINVEHAWSGQILFDAPRHRQNMHLPMDWPRINQFPEWFTADMDSVYLVRDLTNNISAMYTGEQLQKGIDVHIEPHTPLKLSVRQLD